jgi:hypothetical protein
VQTRVLSKKVGVGLLAAAILLGALLASYSMAYSTFSMPSIVAMVAVLNGLVFLLFGPPDFRGVLASAWAWIGIARKSAPSQGPGPEPPRRPPGEEPEPGRKVEAGAPLSDGLPTYTREEVEQTIAATRASLATTIFSGGEQVGNLKDQLHYLHCYRLAYMVSSSSSPCDMETTKQLALSQFKKQRALLGGDAGAKGI